MCTGVPRHAHTWSYRGRKAPCRSAQAAVSWPLAPCHGRGMSCHRRCSCAVSWPGWLCRKTPQLATPPPPPPPPPPLGHDTLYVYCSTTQPFKQLQSRYNVCIVTQPASPAKPPLLQYKFHPIAHPKAMSQYNLPLYRDTVLGSSPISPCTIFFFFVFLFFFFSFLLLEKTNIYIYIHIFFFIFQNTK